MRYVVCLIFALSCYCLADAQIINTIAGSSCVGYGGDGGPATAACLRNPIGMRFDAAGNMFVSDALNHRIRKIDASGTITTIAGTGSAGFSGDAGPATAANLYEPSGVAFDRAGNLYFADRRNNRIRKIDTSGTITTIAGNGTAGFGGDGGPATAARLNGPYSIAVDGPGTLFISDFGNYRIRRVTTSGIINTIAGTGTSGYSGDGGPATAANIYSTFEVICGNAGNITFVDNHRIRNIDNTGVITTIAGTGAVGSSGDGGPATAANISAFGLLYDCSGNLLVTEASNYHVRKINTSGIITNIAGTGYSGFSGDGGPATAARMGGLRSLELDCIGNIYFVDYSNCRIRKISYSNSAPYFASGASQSLSICQGAGSVALDTLLAVADSDCGQTETWSVITSPSHGSLIAAYSAISNTGTIIPSALRYTPATGYSGSDTFTIMVSDCGNLADTINFYVTIIPTPSAGSILGLSSVCAGYSITLTDASTGGSWTTTNAIATVSVAGTVSGISTGIDTVLYITANSCGADTARHSISVTNLAITVTPSGPTTFCAGSSVTLTADTGTGYTYQWYTGSTPISGETNNSYFTNIAGSYKVLVTSAYCSGTSAVTSVIVNPLPVTTISASGVTTFCTGGSVVLNATSVAGYNYQWSNSGANISGATASAYTAATNGSYKVRIINTTTGCMDSTTTPVTVTVNPLPSNTVTASGALTFCPGANVTFSAATGSGYTWQWYNGASTISGATHSTFTATTAGNYKARITNSFGCSDTSAVYTVSLYSAPTATITPAVSTGICYGDTATLTAASGTGYTYQWYIGGTPISGATNASYRTTTLANYSVRVTNSTGCTANSAVTAVVYAGPAAAITTAGSTYFCSGGLALHATTGTGYSWQWYNGSTTIAGATSSIYIATATGTYKVKVTDGTGCASMSAPVTATDLSLPIIVAAGPTTFCKGNSVSLSISTAGGTGSTPVIYQWKRNYVNISGATTGSYIATLGGSYTCYENIGGSCIATTPALVVTVTNCHLEISLDSMKQGIRLYPNPVMKELTIEGAKGFNVVFYDVVGRQVLHQAIVSDRQVTNVADLPKGIYLVQILDNITGAKVLQKLLKE